MTIYYICYYRVLSKQGSGIIQREPHEAALIVHACAYLHNLSIDEGLVPLTRETQKDPDMEPLILRNAVTFLLNAVKRNRHRVFKAHYRRQKMSEYLRGVAKRDQILRGQFGERSVRLGYVGPKKRPATAEDNAVVEVETSATRPRGRPRKAASDPSRTPTVDQSATISRPRGRPRKNASQQPAAATPKPSTRSAGQKAVKKKSSQQQASAKSSTSSAVRRLPKQKK